MKPRSLWLPLACVAGVGVLALGGIYGHWRLPFGLSWHIERCETDDEVDAVSRAAYEGAALKFVRAIIGSVPERAYDEDTSAAFKAASQRDDFLKLAQTQIRPFGAVEDWRVQHSYHVNGVTVGQGQPKAVICTAVAHGSSSVPEGRVIVARAVESEQAYVIVEGGTADASWAFVVSMTRDAGRWLVYGFHITDIAVAGQSALDLWRLGRAQHDRQHDFNALVLDATALQLSVRGPALQLGIQPEIKTDLDALPRPNELETQAPYRWRFEGVSAAVAKIGPVGVHGRMYLRIIQLLEPWTDDQDADRQNRDLVAAFLRTHPEYRDAFDGLAVDAVERNGTHTFRTVAEAPAVSQ